jgi:hypothetical protein
MSLDVVDEAATRDQMAWLRDLVMQDQALQAELAALAIQPAFTAAMAALARSHGADLAAERLARPARADPLGLDRFEQPAWGAPREPQVGWLPSQIAMTQAGLAVDWMRFGAHRLTEPFYEEAVRWAIFRPFNRQFRFQTPLAALSGWAARLPTVPPAGFIFHMSRCGSTLAAQMLARPSANVVVSEAPPIDGAVRIARFDPAFAGPAGDALMRDMISVFGQRRDADARRLFVKLDCWHAMMLPLFRRAFPTTPWIFLYRDPVEVMVSQMRIRGSQFEPQFTPPGLFGIDLSDGVADEDYCARVLGRICGAALESHDQGGGLLVNYRELPEAMFMKILPHFSVTPTPDEREAMAGATRFDAKSPGAEFAADSAGKRAEASASIKAVCAGRLDEVYGRLEARRRAQDKPRAD